MRASCRSEMRGRVVFSPHIAKKVNRFPREAAALSYNMFFKKYNCHSRLYDFLLTYRTIAHFLIQMAELWLLFYGIQLPTASARIEFFNIPYGLLGISFALKFRQDKHGRYSACAVMQPYHSHRSNTPAAKLNIVIVGKRLLHSLNYFFKRFRTGICVIIMIFIK